MKKIITFFLAFFLLVPFLAKGEVPDRAKEYLPLVDKEIKDVWPTHPHKPSVAGQIEQETCITLKHSKCWNPRAELKTSREYGFGLGQITVTSRFDNFKEFRKTDRRLRDWDWEERYDPKRQIIALIAQDKLLYNHIDWSNNKFEKLAFSLSAYNGGMTGVIRDKELCEEKDSCDPSKWFDNVEKYSWKSKTSVHGYGKSFYEINREYVRNILKLRYKKYVEYLR
jgi:hypothetical protein